MIFQALCPAERRSNGHRRRNRSCDIYPVKNVPLSQATETEYIWRFARQKNPLHFGVKNKLKKYRFSTCKNLILGYNNKGRMIKRCEYRGLTEWLRSSPGTRVGRKPRGFESHALCQIEKQRWKHWKMKLLALFFRFAAAKENSLIWPDFTSKVGHPLGHPFWN